MPEVEIVKTTTVKMTAKMVENLQRIKMMQAKENGVKLNNSAAFGYALAVCCQAMRAEKIGRAHV